MRQLFSLAILGLLAMGCAYDAQSESSALRWRHPADAGTVVTPADAGTIVSPADAGTIASTDAGQRASTSTCALCTQAEDCCHVVSGASAPNCSFSAQTCEAEPGNAQYYYIQDCLVFLNTVRGAWGGNPPAVCR